MRAAAGDGGAASLDGRATGAGGAAGRILGGRRLGPPALGGRPRAVFRRRSSRRARARCPISPPRLGGELRAATPAAHRRLHRWRRSARRCAASRAHCCLLPRSPRSARAPPAAVHLKERSTTSSSVSPRRGDSPRRPRRTLGGARRAQATAFNHPHVASSDGTRSARRPSPRPAGGTSPARGAPPPTSVLAAAAMSTPPRVLPEPDERARRRRRAPRPPTRAPPLSPARAGRGARMSFVAARRRALLVPGAVPNATRSRSSASSGAAASPSRSDRISPAPSAVPEPKRLRAGARSELIDFGSRGCASCSTSIETWALRPRRSS